MGRTRPLINYQIRGTSTHCENPQGPQSFLSVADSPGRVQGFGRLLGNQFGVRSRLIKTSERPSFLIPSARSPHLHTSFLRVAWSTSRPQLAAILRTMISVGKSSLIEVSAPHVRSSTLRSFSRPSRSPPSPDRLELFQASSMEHCNHRQHDIRGRTVRFFSLKSSVNLTKYHQGGPLFATIAPSVLRDLPDKPWPINLPANHLW